MKRLAAGDATAEALLVERYGRGVALVLDRQTTGQPESEDLYQETFRLAIVKLRRGELREASRLPGFLAAIARNLAIEHYRKRNRRQTEPDSEAAEATPWVGANPLDACLASEQAILVRRLLGELRNDRDREILARFYIAEEDKERICADLALDSQQFNRVLYRARQRYRELYEDRAAAGLATALLATALLASLLLAALDLSAAGLARIDGR